MANTKTSENKIRLVLRDAIELASVAGRRVSNRTIVERVYDSEPTLMAEYQREWSIDRMLWMIAKERRERYMNHTPDAVPVYTQINLPGFEDLPQTIFLRNGRRYRLDLANVTQINEHIAMLKARMERAGKIAKFQAMLKVMNPYSEVQPGISWGEVKDLELKKASGGVR
jgi:hypothetical protein